MRWTRDFFDENQWFAAVEDGDDTWLTVGGIYCVAVDGDVFWDWFLDLGSEAFGTEATKEEAQKALEAAWGGSDK